MLATTEDMAAKLHGSLSVLGNADHLEGALSDYDTKILENRETEKYLTQAPITMPEFTLHPSRYFTESER